VEVFARATIALLSTGDEIVEPSTVSVPFGKIRDRYVGVSLCLSVQLVSFDCTTNDRFAAFVNIIG
jgi:molybdopterin biosynthesis enzyme